MADDKTDNNLKKIESFKHKLDKSIPVDKNSMLSAKPHDNKLTIQWCEKISSTKASELAGCHDVEDLSFEEDKHYISSEQPYSGVETKGSTIIVKAGRHQSEDVVTSLNKDFPLMEKLGQWIYSVDLPGKLNFAVLGDLSFAYKNEKYNFNDFVIAQRASWGHRQVN